MTRDNRSFSRRSNGRRRQQQQRNNGIRSPAMASTQFQGGCPELKGRIYDCNSDDNEDPWTGFTLTTKAIARYVNIAYEYGNDTYHAVLSLKVPELPKYPPAPLKDASDEDQIEWEVTTEMLIDRRYALQENLNKLYFLIWDQCTERLQHKLKMMDNYKSHYDTMDGLGLLRSVKHAIYGFPSHMYYPHALVNAYRRFYSFYQRHHTSNEDYLNEFQCLVEVILYNCGCIIGDPAMLQKMAHEKQGVDSSDRTGDPDTKVAQDQYLAMAFLLGANRARYESILIQLHNSYLLGRRNVYPQTVSVAFCMLDDFEDDPDLTLERIRAGGNNPQGN
jgi:hypothetical protein